MRKSLMRHGLAKQKCLYVITWLFVANKLSLSLLLSLRSRLKCVNSMSGCRSEANKLVQILGPQNSYITEPNICSSWNINNVSDWILRAVPVAGISPNTAARLYIHLYSHRLVRSLVSCVSETRFCFRYDSLTNKVVDSWTKRSRKFNKKIVCRESRPSATHSLPTSDGRSIGGADVCNLTPPSCLFEQRPTRAASQHTDQRLVARRNPTAAEALA